MIANNSRVWWIIPLLFIVVLFCPFADGKVMYLDDDAITATASLTRGSYTIGQEVPIEIAVTNHGQKPVYTYVDESGFLDLSVVVEDVNGTKIEHGPIASPPPPPRHWWITIDGKKVLTMPVAKIEPGQTTKLTIRDALNLYHDYLQEGVYYLILRELPVIHEVGFVVIREDQVHPLWIDPYTVISRGRYEINNKVKITLYQRKIIYVDDDAVGLNDGSSWENAYTFLQDALYNAETSEKPVEIRVAQGVYKPNKRMPQTPGDGDNTFTLIKEVTLKGGYAGFGEQDPNTRDVELYETILSGDLNGDDVEVVDPCDMLLIESNRSDNSPVVVRANYTDATTVLDGFVITGGCFMDIYTMPSNGGAGMRIYQGSPAILNCTFIGNVAYHKGGGLLNQGSSNPTLVNCTFTGNYAGLGGGIYNNSTMPAPGMISEDSHPTLVNCTFDNNYALKNGGGMYNSASKPTVIDCTFHNNQVIGPYSGSTRGPYTGGGGGMYNSNSNPVLTNCQFSENSAGGGGGICNIADSNVALTNCTFKDNSASAIGGGLSNLKNCMLTLTSCEFINNSVTGIGGGLANDSGNAMLVKCVFSGNQAYDWSIPSTSQVFSGLGGGMSTGSNSTLINCKFQFNYATEGAGMYLSGSPELIGCIFIGNYAIEDGGGIQNVGTSSEPVITNCIFSRNSANRGGGIFFTCGARMIIANCTFAGNSAYIGGALASDPHLPSLPGYFQLTNCILWDGEDTIFDPEPYALRSAITYSNVQGGWPGEGNIDSDPCFADPGYWADADDPNIAAEPNDPNAVWIDGDYHLKSQAGRWDPASESWVFDDVTSPCIDAGDPNTSVGDEPEPNGGRINMGAYGGTSEASKSIRP